MLQQVPESERTRLMEAISRAESLRKANQASEGIQILRKLMAEFPEASIVHVFLAWNLLKEGQNVEAIEVAQDAVQLAPKSEIASIVLYLTRMKAGLLDSALDEMKRFIKIGGKSKEYSRLIKEFRRIMDEDDAERDAE
jgi:predicted Zn-dependent protease